jgi:hypothetical protein
MQVQFERRERRHLRRRHSARGFTVVVWIWEVRPRFGLPSSDRGFHAVSVHMAVGDTTCTTHRAIVVHRLFHLLAYSGISVGELYSYCQYGCGNPRYHTCERGVPRSGRRDVAQSSMSTTAHGLADFARGSRRHGGIWESSGCPAPPHLSHEGGPVTHAEADVATGNDFSPGAVRARGSRTHPGHTAGCSARPASMWRGRCLLEDLCPYC